MKRTLKDSFQRFEHCGQEKREKIKLLSQTTDKPAEISAGLSVV